MADKMEPQGFALRFFEGREVRAVWHEDEWWYSTADAVGAFVGVDNPSAYWSKLKRRLQQEGGDTFPKWKSISLQNRNGNGRKRPVDCSNEAMLLRIVQSMPTTRVEHIRQWLAEVGAERLREERNPELITERAVRTLRRRYGMTEQEAAQSVQATAARNQLTGEWQRRGIRGNQYAILTDVGHETTFDVRIKAHKELKGLQPQENLRPNMTPSEIVLTMLQETTEVEIVRNKDLKGFHPIRDAAVVSGTIAAQARASIESATGSPVVSSYNRKRPALESAK